MFNGAVKVDSNKIRSAIVNYTKLRLEYLDEEKRCQEVLAREVGTLTWWEKFKCNSDYYDWAKVYYTKYYYTFLITTPEYASSWLYKFYEVGLLIEETLDKYLLVEEYHNHYTKCNIVATLGVFTLVGDSIYLNEEQARFVGYFCDQELL